jgi:hypothetical protein
VPVLRRGTALTVHDPTSKHITVCVKVTRSEALALKALAKTPGKGLRVLLDKHLPKGEK